MNIDKNISMQIGEIAKCFSQIEKVVLFGSRVRGDHRERSDIDLAIYAKGDISAFIDEIEIKVKTLLEFDFSNMNEVEDVCFREQVEKEGVVLYEKSYFRYMNLERAYQRLKEACEAYDGKNDMIRDSMIQRFEFTYELTHKTLQEFMKYEGVTLENSYPRTIFKKAYINHLIDEDSIWIKLLEDRNATSHIYSEKLADEIASRIQKEYLSAIGTLVERIGKAIK